MTEKIFFEASEERTVCLLFDSTEKIDDSADEIVEKSKIWVSKELLSMASPVFKRMFYGEFRENQENSRDQQHQIPIHLPWKKLDEFLIVLECLLPNADRKEVDQSNVRVIFPLAHEYQIDLLIVKCVQCFMDGLCQIAIGNEAILGDVPFFTKYELTCLIEYIIPYAAALKVEIIDKYRKENREKLSPDHPFYFAVYEAKVHRLSLEQQFQTQPYEAPSSSYRPRHINFLPARTIRPPNFHYCGDNGNDNCLCGYKFARELLHL